jgi:hypothetical protein
MIRAAAVALVLAGCAAETGGVLVLAVDRSSGTGCACHVSIDPVMERLGRLAGVREARADWQARHVLVRLAAGTRAEEVAAAMSDVHPPVRRLDAAAQKACLDRTAIWLTSEEAGRLSRREADAIASRYADAAAARAGLDDGQRAQLRTVLAARLGDLFEAYRESRVSAWTISEEFLGHVLAEVRERYWSLAGPEQTLATSEELKAAAGLR